MHTVRRGATAAVCACGAATGAGAADVPLSRVPGDPFRKQLPPAGSVIVVSYSKHSDFISCHSANNVRVATSALLCDDRPETDQDRVNAYNTPRAPNRTPASLLFKEGTAVRAAGTGAAARSHRGHRRRRRGRVRPIRARRNRLHGCGAAAHSRGDGRGESILSCVNMCNCVSL